MNVYELSISSRLNSLLVCAQHKLCAFDVLNCAESALLCVVSSSHYLIANDYILTHECIFNEFEFVLVK